MTAKEKSKEYIENYLKSSNEYPLVDNHQRKKLIKVDLNRMERAFEDGYRQAIEDIKIHLNHHSDQSFFDNILK